MIKKILSLLAVIVLLTVCVSPVSGQGSLEVLSTSTKVDFPGSLTFKISAQSDAEINEIRLQYSVEQLSFANIINEAFIQFSPSKTVDIEWKWDLMRIYGLPPGTIVTYQWILVDASGDKLKTSPQEVRFDDNRFQWQSLTENKITVYWYDRNTSFGEEIMDSVQSSLTNLSENIGAYITEPVRLYIYGSQSDLLSAMIYPQEWTGGAMFSRYNCIAIGISSVDIEWGKGAITHEFTHVITEQMTLNPYNDIPTWLDEGLAMYSEGYIAPVFSTYLTDAIKNDTLISVRSLASPFSSYSDISYLSYAESFSIVDFLISTYGKNKIFALLETFRQGNTYDDALQIVYGFDMDGLNTIWQAAVKAR
jgi:hypothetical protein